VRDIKYKDWLMFGPNEKISPNQKEPSDFTRLAPSEKHNNALLSRKDYFVHYSLWRSSLTSESLAGGVDNFFLDSAFRVEFGILNLPPAYSDHPELNFYFSGKSTIAHIGKRQKFIGGRCLGNPPVN